MGLSLLIRCIYACLTGIAVFLLIFAVGRLAFGNGDQQNLEIADNLLKAEVVQQTQVAELTAPAVQEFIHTSVVFAASAGTACALLWMVPAMWFRHREHAVELARGYRLAWIGVLIVTALLVFLKCRFFSGLGDIETSIDDSSKYVALLIFVLITLVVYWLATAVGANRSMRPAVPLAHYLP